ncbi:hypothetical protein PSR1_04281 [Anaeromyxobacter sp. PSR-1]|nr:hypothetical protein PSR1_04281 [Anaeromyxobacter sp. PSR-1]
MSTSPGHTIFTNRAWNLRSRAPRTQSITSSPRNPMLSMPGASALGKPAFFAWTSSMQSGFQSCAAPA